MTFVLGTNSPVIRQKDKSQNGGNKKTKHAEFSEKRTFLTPPPPLIRTRKKCSFFGKSGVLRFLVTSVLRLALLPYYRRIPCLQKLIFAVLPIMLEYCEISRQIHTLLL